MRVVLVALLLVVTGLAGCATDTSPPQAPVEAGEAPSWSFTDTEGQTHSANSSQGSPTVLFFFATWCSSCRAMTDDLAQVHAQYEADGVDLYSISWDPSESDSDFEAWKERYDQPWPHGKDPASSIAKTFGVRSQSSVVVLDSDGHVVQGWGYGQASHESIAAALERALAA